MAATLVTPIDPITGLPAMIAPRCNPESLEVPGVATLHHLWHTKSALTALGIAGIAQKSSAIQVIEKEDHNYGPLSFHKFWLPPGMLKNETEIFRRIIASCSGAIPQLVCDVNGGDPIERPATQAEVDFMRTPADDDQFGYKYMIYRYQPVRDFFRAHIFQQNISHIRDGLIDEFLHTGDPRQKIKLGGFLLRNATHVATDSVREDYFRMQRSGLIHPAMPKEVETLVAYKLGNDEQRPDVIQQYGEHLKLALT